MKYIIVDKSGIELAILFHEAIQHFEAVNEQEADIVSAGFCNVHADGTVTAWGGSDSLRIGSRPEDARVIEMSLLLSKEQAAPALECQRRD